MQTLIKQRVCAISLVPKMITTLTISAAYSEYKLVDDACFEISSSVLARDRQDTVQYSTRRRVNAASIQRALANSIILNMLNDKSKRSCNVMSCLCHVM